MARKDHKPDESDKTSPEAPPETPVSEDAAPPPETPEPEQTDEAQAAEAKAEDALAELAALRRELEEAQDRALRCRADLENYKQRVARQAEQERRLALVPLLRDLLPVADNLGRALEAAERNTGGAGLIEGVKMVLQQLHTVFERYDCREIEALHQPFDPHLHEAVSQQPTDAFPPGTVVQVVQTGFQLHERVVRPSQVIVSAPPQEE